MSRMDIQTLRGPKILGMSIFDWVTSLFGAYLVGHYMLHIKSQRRWLTWILLWIIFGVLIHAIFGINTMLGYYLGINPKPQRPS